MSENVFQRNVVLLENISIPILYMSMNANLSQKLQHVLVYFKKM